MDVHECQLRTYPSIPITAIAFSHTQTESTEQTLCVRLAVGRENGDIEIWNPFTWYQEKIIHGGGSERAIDGLTWVSDPDWKLDDGKTVVGSMRLFSIGLTATITEWDLAKGIPRRHATGIHGEIWCLAPLPPPSPHKDSGSNQKPGKPMLSPTPSKIKWLIGGTNKGELVLYSVEDDQLRFERVIVRQSKSFQITSIAFRDHKTAVIGCSDSAVRVYDVRKGTLLSRMSIHAVRGPKETIVWSVKCLPGGDIVSADESGQICIWDGKTLSQAQALQVHKDHAVTLAVSGDGSSIVSGSNDKRLVWYNRRARDDKWTPSPGQRYHEAEIKTMAAFESGSGNTSIVVSGGVDGALVVAPLKQRGKEHHRRLPHVPHEPQAISAPHSRLMVSWEGREIRIHSIYLTWRQCNELAEQEEKLKHAQRIADLRMRLAHLQETEDADPDEMQELVQQLEQLKLNNPKENLRLLSGIRMKGEANIASATINEHGSFLVVSQASSGIKAFHLLHNQPRAPSDITVRPVTIPADIAKSVAAKVVISPDSRWLCVIRDATEILIMRIHVEPDADSSGPSLHPKAQRLKRLRREVARQKALGPLNEYSRTITKACFSPDSKILAVSDLAGYVDVWKLGNSVQNGTKGEGDDASESSSSDESDNEQANGVADAGERWMRPASSSRLPLMRSTIAALSVTTGVRYPYDAVAHGASDGPVDEYTLLIVTAPFNVFTFNPLSGSMNEWSRRNSLANMPAEMADSRDCAKGILWHGPRAWIYGFNSLFMLNVGVDTGVTREEASKKRKRMGPDSGAGSKIEAHELELGPRKVVKLQDGKREVLKEAKKGGRRVGSDDEDDGFVDGGVGGGELEALRKGSGLDSAAEGNELAVVDQTTAVGPRRPWQTIFRYRNILGAVPLGDPAAAQNPERPLEVAIVEWPFGQNLPDKWEEKGQKKYF